MTDGMFQLTDIVVVFPEMRAQLRTYHAIPSLQAHQDATAYKQLQDAPRLKSILKGGCEDRAEPSSLDKIRRVETPPRTNPVSLIFVICAASCKIADLHFPVGQEFYDLILKTKYSSTSRARAFLWLMWFYLESDFTQEGCDENPFGPGVDYGQDVANQGVPTLEELDAAGELLENVDAADEVAFGREKQAMRAKISEADLQFLADRDLKRARARAATGGPAEDGPAILPRIRPSKNESDMDSTRSTPPPLPPSSQKSQNQPPQRPQSSSSSSRIASSRNNALLSAAPPTTPAQRTSNPASTKERPALKWQQPASGISSPAEPANHRGQLIDGLVARKPRPPTSHQLAVERNRAQRVEHIISTGLRIQHRASRKRRRLQGALYRVWRRHQAYGHDDIDDSEEDLDLAQEALEEAGMRERGVGGLALRVDEEEDYGEEVTAFARGLRRAARRVSRRLVGDAGGKRKREPDGDEDSDEAVVDTIEQDLPAEM